MRSMYVWFPLPWTPLRTAAIVWFTHRYAPGAKGSGIPQVIAALEPSLEASYRDRFVSIRLTVAKFLLTALGPSCWPFAGPRRPFGSGGCRCHACRAPLACVAFDRNRARIARGGGVLPGLRQRLMNAPLAGVMFAIEEVSRASEQRSSGLIISAIVLARLTAVCVCRNNAHFGVIEVRDINFSLVVPSLLVALCSGTAGGALANLLIRSLGGRGTDVFTRWRQKSPVAFAAVCGLAVAIIGDPTDGATFCSGYAHSKIMLSAREAEPLQYAAVKYVAPPGSPPG